MEHKGIAFVLAAVLFCTVIASVPVSEAASVSTVTCSGVTLTIIEDEISLTTTDNTEIHAHIHNSNSIAVTVSVSEQKDSVIKVSSGSGAISIPSGSTVDTKFVLSTDDSTDVGTYMAVMILSVMDGINPVSSAELSVDVKVVSYYSDGSAYNKFMGVFENNLGSPLNQPWFTTLVTFVIWILISFAVGIVLFDVIKAIFKVSKIDGSELNKNSIYWLSLCVMIQGVSNSLNVWGVESSVMESIEKAVAVIYVPLIAIVVWDVYKTLVYNALLKSEKSGISNIDTSLVPLFNLVGKLIIIITCITTVLSINNVDVAAIIAAAGIAGLGISLGAKPMMNQFFSGIMLMFARPFKEGDAVKIGSSDVRIVKKVNILQTEFLGDGTKEHFYYSNNSVISSKITNLTGRAKAYRKTLTVRVPFDVDMELAKRLMTEAAAEVPNVITDGSHPKPNVLFQEYGDGSMVKLRLEFYVTGYSVSGSTAGLIREVIMKKFSENGITIPMSAYELTVVDFKGDVNEN